ncbi:MAG: CRTAC1 family protein [Thermoanaerobaculia bacterium]|nr:CRTAC1 family protein [Thermoanaerobaculia bacterium]
MVLIGACDSAREVGKPAGDQGREREAESLRVDGNGADAPIVFADIAVENGLDFVHSNGMTGHLYFAEPVGAGAALFDVDGDGDLDIFLVQGGALGANASDAGIKGRPREGGGPWEDSPSGGRLYRNDLKVSGDGSRTVQFTDVTMESGLQASGYGMGVASGDFDNDGRTDLYLTNFGPNQLWRNVSDGKRIAFEEVTQSAGVEENRWSTGATFADLDADGWLDLFVTNYVDFDLLSHKTCSSSGGRPDYCGPQSYDGESDRLWQNRGDGTFQDVSGRAGILLEPSSGLGVVAVDLDLDGWLDLYVTNDLRRNVLWHNRGGDGLSFEDVALETGTAVSMLGRAQASMGVVAEDFDGDADDDLFMTHLTADTNTLYVNDGGGTFEDRSNPSGLGASSLEATGFGVAALDGDNDGRLDLVIANGAVKSIEVQARSGDPLPLKQANQLFRNFGSGRFTDASQAAGLEFSRLEVSRGAVSGDIDNDGRSDVLITNNNGAARLLHNVTESGNHWIGLRVLEKHGSDALGARVQVLTRDSSVWRRVSTDGSYLSARDPRVLVGLGLVEAPVSVRVHWLRGGIEEWQSLAPGQYYSLRRGEGDPVKSEEQE